MHETWKSHFSDWTFKFSINYGLAASGRVILTDLGEFTFARRSAEQLVHKKPWLSQPALHTLEEGPLKTYYLEQTHANFTLERFNRL